MSDLVAKKARLFVAFLLSSLLQPPVSLLIINIEVSRAVSEITYFNCLVVLFSCHLQWQLQWFKWRYPKKLRNHLNSRCDPSAPKTFKLVFFPQRQQLRHNHNLGYIWFPKTSVSITVLEHFDVDRDFGLHLHDTAYRAILPMTVKVSWVFEHFLGPVAPRTLL